MTFDWFTFGAQILNFIILVWLMKRFLYRPILDAVDAREQKIAAELADADAKKAEAQKQRDEFERKSGELEQQRVALLAKAKVDADAEHERLLGEDRKAEAAARAKREATVQSEIQALHRALAQRAQTEVFSIARKALKDLAEVNLEDSVCAVFIARLEDLKGEAKADIIKALKTASQPALVRSAFDLSDTQRTAITAALKALTSSEVPTRFEVGPQLISGIELTSNGQKIAWSIADYLATLEDRVNEVVNDKPQATPKPTAKSAPADVAA